MRQPYFIFIAFVAGFAVAQVTKFLVGLAHREGKGKKRNVKELIGYLTRSGGMPSGHAASLAAATTVAFLCTLDGTSVGATYNLALPAATPFFILLCVDFIVLYDAVNVRYAVGEQGKKLNKMLKNGGEAELRVVEGHKVSEVAVGVLLGVLVGVAVIEIATNMGCVMPWYF